MRAKGEEDKHREDHLEMHRHFQQEAAQDLFSCHDHESVSPFCEKLRPCCNNGAKYQPSWAWGGCGGGHEHKRNRPAHFDDAIKNDHNMSMTLTNRNVIRNMIWKWWFREGDSLYFGTMALLLDQALSRRRVRGLYWRGGRQSCPVLLFWKRYQASDFTDYARHFCRQSLDIYISSRCWILIINLQNY